jgi:hypothetical protein
VRPISQGRFARVFNIYDVPPITYHYGEGLWRSGGDVVKRWAIGIRRHAGQDASLQSQVFAALPQV